MKIIDLTHQWTGEMLTIPGDPSFQEANFANITHDGYELTQYQIHSHLGTHLDAPKHIILDGKSVSDFPLSQFCGRAVCVPFPNHLETWFAKYGKSVATAEIVLFRSDWSIHFGTPAYCADFPVLPVALTQWLCETQLKLVGVDTPSLDHLTGELANHQLLLAHDMILVENLTNLASLPASFSFQAFPLPVVAGDGSPVRAIAFVNERSD